MTRPHALPLDGDALDRAEGHVVAVGFVRAGLVDDLLAQSRAALALEAERDALKAQVERLREALAERGSHEWSCPLGDFRGGRPTDGGGYEFNYHGKWYETRPVDRTPKCECEMSALDATPAQSLAAHDAEVRAKALREAAERLREQHGDMTLEHYAREIEALAERAPEVER